MDFIDTWQGAVVILGAWFLLHTFINVVNNSFRPPVLTPEQKAQAAIRKDLAAKSAETNPMGWDKRT